MIIHCIAVLIREKVLNVNLFIFVAVTDFSHAMTFFIYFYWNCTENCFWIMDTACCLQSFCRFLRKSVKPRAVCSAAIASTFGIESWKKNFHGCWRKKMNKRAVMCNDNIPLRTRARSSLILWLTPEVGTLQRLTRNLGTGIGFLLPKAGMSWTSKSVSNVCFGRRQFRTKFGSRKMV